MLKKHSQFFESLLFIADIVIIVASWLLSYYLRFHTAFVPIDKGTPPLRIYILLVIPIVLIWGFIFKSFGLYRPRRIASHLSELFDITKACLVSILVLIAVTFVYRQYEFSRLVFLFFGIMNVAALSIERWIFREALRYLRKKGHNLRYALIIGTGEMSKEILTRIEAHPEIGLKVIGLLSTNKDEIGANTHGIKVLGMYNEVGRFIKEKGIDHVIIALAWEDHGKVIDVLKNIGEEMVDIKVVPDIYELATIRGGIEEFDGLPIISLQDSPLYGWNMVIKRAFDIIFSVIAIAITAPVMLIAAIAIKLTSHGPVLYRQERMSLNGKKFMMLKFRSMNVAEGPEKDILTKKGDTRITKIGSILRKTSVDELPQFFNVFKGDMSIVGPRPERTWVVEQVKRDIPGYILKHKMKAGITGWAQVNGWRGDTDLKKRIEYDLYYIENWSLLLDLKIIWLTIWKGLINKNAY